MDENNDSSGGGGKFAGVMIAVLAVAWVLFQTYVGWNSGGWFQCRNIMGF